MAEPETDPTAPLAGVRVIDLTRVVAGPVCGRVLADLGADVIKIEPPDGDIARVIAPKSDRGMSGLYTVGNLGKRNLCVDLRAPGATELLLDLIERADVVLENFRPAVMERLGLDWDVIHQRNPRAILLSINGYGSQSKWKNEPAYAPMMHAVAGVLHWEAQTTELPVAQMADNKADMSAGLHGAIAVLAALFRTQTNGVGEHLEVPMFDALLASYSETAYALLPTPEAREECRLFDAGPYGWIAIAGTPQNAWRIFREATSVVDPAKSATDVPTKARLRHAAMESWMVEQENVEAILEILGESGLVAARVQSLTSALHGPIARERELLFEVDDRRGGVRPVVRAPYWFSGKTGPLRRPAPRCGEHNEEVLRQVLDFDDERIAGLRSSGVLVDSPDETTSEPAAE